MQSVPRHIFVWSSLAAGVESSSPRFSSVRRVPALQGFSPFCSCLITQPASPLKHFCQDHIIVVGIIVGLLLSSGPCKINLFASSNIIVVHISSFVLTTPINFISTISIADFLEVLLPFYNPSSGSLRLLLLLLLPSLPTPLRAILGI